jgi:TonB family protein
MITATWAHIAGAVILMNTSVATLEPLGDYQGEEPLILVQRLLQHPSLQPKWQSRLSAPRKISQGEDREIPTQPETVTNPVPAPLVVSNEAQPERLSPLEPTVEEAVEDSLAEQFVRVEESGEAAPTQSSRIAKFNSEAAEEHRTVILSENEGLVTPSYRELVARRDDGQSGVENRVQTDKAMSGSLTSTEDGRRMVVNGTNGEIAGAPAPLKPGGGNNGSLSGQTGKSGGIESDNRLPAASGTVSGEQAAAEFGGYPFDENATHQDERPAPKNWQPKVFRYASSRNPGSTPPSSFAKTSTRLEETPSPVRRHNIYKAAHKRNTGESKQDGPKATAPAETASEALTTAREEMTIEVRALGPEELDPVAQFREALGWAGLEQEVLAPHRGSVGLVGSDGRSAASPQTVLPEEYPLSNSVAVTAMATDLGAYLHEMDLRISRAWNQTDLPMEERALGIQGRVTLVLQIRNTGRVRYLSISASSGNSRLDAMAAEAIPRRFKAFPPGLNIDGITHRITLRYSNPLILSTGD